MQPLLKSAQAHLIPPPRLAYDNEQDEQDTGSSHSYDPAMGGNLYDEEGNDLLVLDQGMSSDAAFVNSEAVINDNCIPLGLSVYEDYGIANVTLSEHWRVYPNDDNLQQLKSMIDEEDLYFHYS